MSTLHPCKPSACSQVELDLDFNAYANARAHYEKRKQHLVKQQKTVDANEKALKAAEKKAQHQLSQVRTKTAIQHVRKPHWFEKFNWFVTSENYLVISGRDAQQNELIVKRYLKKGLPCAVHSCLSAGLQVYLLCACSAYAFSLCAALLGLSDTRNKHLQNIRATQWASVLALSTLWTAFVCVCHATVSSTPATGHADCDDKSGLQHECHLLWPRTASG